MKNKGFEMMVFYSFDQEELQKAKIKQLQKEKYCKGKNMRQKETIQELKN